MICFVVKKPNVLFDLGPVLVYCHLNCLEKSVNILLNFLVDAFRE